MIRIKATYLDLAEKEKFLEKIKKTFQVLSVSKEYQSGKYKRIHVDVK